MRGGKERWLLVSAYSAEYRAKVLAYVEKEDSPRSLNDQLVLPEKAGFKSVEILYKNICFAAYGGIK